MPVMLNVGCGPFRAPSPWVNLDCHDGDGVNPDVIVDPRKPLEKWEKGTVDKVYMGHVLEHIQWILLPEFLDDIFRALRPGGEIAVVGPDCFKILHQWRDGKLSWDMVASTLESPWDHTVYKDKSCKVRKSVDYWPDAHHWWNCEEERLVWLFEKQTPFQDIKPCPITASGLRGWPVVSYSDWQCALTAKKPLDAAI